MKKVILQCFDGEVRIIEEALSDDSCVYNVEVGKYEIPAISHEAAKKAYSQIIRSEGIALAKI